MFFFSNVIFFSSSSLLFRIYNKPPGGDWHTGDVTLMETGRFSHFFPLTRSIPPATAYTTMRGADRKHAPRIEPGAWFPPTLYKWEKGGNKNKSNRRADEWHMNVIQADSIPFMPLGRARIANRIQSMDVFIFFFLVRPTVHVRTNDDPNGKAKRLAEIKAFFFSLLLSSLVGRPSVGSFYLFIGSKERRRRLCARPCERWPTLNRPRERHPPYLVPTETHGRHRRPPTKYLHDGEDLGVPIAVQARVNFVSPSPVWWKSTLSIHARIDAATFQTARHSPTNYKLGWNTQKKQRGHDGRGRHQIGDGYLFPFFHFLTKRVRKEVAETTRRGKWH